MDVEEAINKYIEAAKSNDFIDYEKKFAAKIVSALSKGYARRLHEPDLVKYVVDSVNNLTKKSFKPHFELSTKAVFIHGYRSQVEFDCYGSKARRELGDLIFISSVLFGGKKYFEKLAINQFKKDSNSNNKSGWDIKNKEQLFLLSRFPVFRGIKGSLIQEKDYALPNYSGSLGSYGLLFKPGDFAFVNAAQLDSLLGRRTYLNFEELNKFHNLCSFYGLGQSSCLYMNTLLFAVTSKLWSASVFGNCEFSSNVYDFVHNYLRMRVGEPIIMKAGVDNSQARDFMYDLLNTARITAQEKKVPELAKFVSLFFQNSYANDSDWKGGNNGDSEFDDNQGVGIIHITIDLGG